MRVFRSVIIDAPIGEVWVSPSTTDDPLVTINLKNVSDGDVVAEVALANGSIDCDTAAYQPFSAGMYFAGWQLPTGDGPKYV